MKFALPKIPRLTRFRRPSWERRRISPWIWVTAAFCGLLIVIAGISTWRLRFSAAAQSRQRNPLALDAPKSPVQALDFTAINLNGKTIKLTDYRGSVVALNFWATWCVPCLEEMPALDRLTQAMAGRKFKVLAVDLQETSDKVHEFAKTHRFGFDLVLDQAGEISSHYGVSRIPVTYVLDQRGSIIWRAIGPRAWDSEDGVNFFSDLVNNPPPLRLPAPTPAGTQPDSGPRAPAPPAPTPGTVLLGGVPK